jgi:hypothetical protein
MADGLVTFVTAYVKKPTPPAVEEVEADHE